MTRPPWIVWFGLAVVLVAAAVLSFDALRALAVAVAIPPALAWLLPLAVDAGAAVSCATWLGGRTDRHTARIAGGMTWALLAVTVLGNAGQLGMHAHGIVPPWWVAVLVGAIPPAIVGAVVHLVVLLIRHRPAPVLVVEDEWAALVRQRDAMVRAGTDHKPPAEFLGGNEGSGTTSHIEPEESDQSAEVERTTDRGTRRTDDELLVELHALVDQLGERPTERAVRTALGVGPPRAQRLLAQLGPRRSVS